MAVTNSEAMTVEDLGIQLHRAEKTKQTGCAQEVHLKKNMLKMIQVKDNAQATITKSKQRPT